MNYLLDTTATRAQWAGPTLSSEQIMILCDALDAARAEIERLQKKIDAMEAYIEMRPDGNPGDGGY